MKKLLAISLYFLMIACCTKVDCGCVGASIVFKLADIQLGIIGNDVIEVTVTDKDFNVQDTFTPTFDGSFYFVVNELRYPSIAKIEDHNFIMKHKVYGSVDTITDITNTRSDYSYKCNDCFLSRDIQHCDNVSAQMLKLNGKLVNGDTVRLKN